MAVSRAYHLQKSGQANTSSSYQGHLGATVVVGSKVSPETGKVTVTSTSPSGAATTQSYVYDTSGKSVSVPTSPSYSREQAAATTQQRLQNVARLAATTTAGHYGSAEQLYRTQGRYEAYNERQRQQLAYEADSIKNNTSRDRNDIRREPMYMQKDINLAQRQPYRAVRNLQSTTRQIGWQPPTGQYFTNKETKQETKTLPKLPKLFMVSQTIVESVKKAGEVSGVGLGIRTWSDVGKKLGTFAKAQGDLLSGLAPNYTPTRFNQLYTSAKPEATLRESIFSDLKYSEMKKDSRIERLAWGAQQIAAEYVTPKNVATAGLVAGVAVPAAMASPVAATVLDIGGTVWAGSFVTSESIAIGKEIKRSGNIAGNIPRAVVDVGLLTAPKWIPPVAKPVFKITGRAVNYVNTIIRPKSPPPPSVFVESKGFAEKISINKKTFEVSKASVKIKIGKKEFVGETAGKFELIKGKPIKRVGYIEANVLDEKNIFPSKTIISSKISKGIESGKKQTAHFKPIPQGKFLPEPESPRIFVNQEEKTVEIIKSAFVVESTKLPQKSKFGTPVYGTKYYEATQPQNLQLKTFQKGLETKYLEMVEGDMKKESFVFETKGIGDENLLRFRKPSPLVESSKEGIKSFKELQTHKEIQHPALYGKKYLIKAKANKEISMTKSEMKKRSLLILQDKFKGLNVNYNYVQSISKPSDYEYPKFTGKLPKFLIKKVPKYQSYITKEVKSKSNLKQNYEYYKMVIPIYSKHYIKKLVPTKMFGGNKGEQQISILEQPSKSKETFGQTVIITKNKNIPTSLAQHFGVMESSARRSVIAEMETTAKLRSEGITKTFSNIKPIQTFFPISRTETNNIYKLGTPQIQRQIPSSKQIQIPIIKSILIHEQIPIQKQISIIKQVPVTTQISIQKQISIIEQVPVTKIIPDFVPPSIPIIIPPPIIPHFPIVPFIGLPPISGFSESNRGKARPIIKQKFKYSPTLHAVFFNIKRSDVWQPAKLAKEKKQKFKTVKGFKLVGNKRVATKIKVPVIRKGDNRKSNSLIRRTSGMFSGLEERGI